MADGPDGREEGGAFLRGDPPTIGRIRDVVRRVVRSFQFPDPGLNGDLAQDAITSVFVNLSSGSFRGEASLETYARRIARYTCLGWIRRRRFEASTNVDSIPSASRWSAPEDSFLWTEEHLRNLQIFSTLPGDCRELLKLVFIEGRSYREAAGILGLTEGAIKTRVHRCRAALKEQARHAERPSPARAARRPRR